MKTEREKLREMLDNMTPEEQVKTRIAVKQGLETALKPENLERLQKGMNAIIKLANTETDEFIWGLAKPNPRKKYKIYCDIKQLDLLIKLFNNDKPFVKMLKENRRKLIKNQTMNN